MNDRILISQLRDYYSPLSKIDKLISEVTGRYTVFRYTPNDTSISKIAADSELLRELYRV